MSKENDPMTARNEESKPSNPMETLKQEASACCGSSCNCHASKPASRCRWIAGVIALVAAGVLVARAMVKDNAAPASPTTSSGFGSMTPAEETPPPASEASLAIQEIAAISDLNTVATNTDAVFVYLAGKDDATGAIPAASIHSASQTIESKAGMEVGTFRLKADSPDYAQLAAQGAVPGVLAMVKGRGMAAVSGEITEAKLVQAFVSASSSGGGCGSSAAGCRPGAAGCGPAASRVGPLMQP